MPCLAGQTAPFDPLGRKNSMLNQSKIKAIVFDWDGVIVDSMPMAALVIQATAASYGVQISVEKILATYFQPKEAFFRGIGIDTTNVTELRARHSANDNKYLYNSNPPLCSDVLPTLEQLAEKQFGLGIVTGRSQNNIQGEIATRGLQRLFSSEQLLGGENAKEENLATLIERFGIASNKLLFVGDLPSDITAAKNIGAKSAGIARHESGKARLKAMGPDYFLDSLTDLLAVVGIVP